MAAFLVDYVLSVVLTVPFVVAWYLGVLDASRRIAAGDVGVVPPAPPATVGLGLFLALLLGLVQWRLAGTRGYTIGKRLLGIRVLDELTAQPIGMGRYLLRQVVLAATGAVVVGYLSPLFDSSGRLRGWHDRAASSAVTEAPADEPGRRAERVARGTVDPAPTSAVPFAVPGAPSAPAPSPAAPGPVPAAPVPQPAAAQAPVPAPPAARSGVPPLPAYLGEPDAATAAQRVVPAHPVPPVPQPPVAPPVPAAQAAPVPQPSPVPQPGLAQQPSPVPPPPAGSNPVPVVPSPVVPPPPGPVAHAQHPVPAAPPVPAQPAHAPTAPAQPSAPYGNAPLGSGASASTAPTAVVPQADASGVITAVPQFGQAAARPAPSAPALVLRPDEPSRPVQAQPAPVAPVLAHAATGPIEELDDETEMTRLRTDPPRKRETSAHIPPSALLRISDGTELTITDTVLIGRNPAPASDESIGELVRVQDPGRSVSKTNLLVGVDADGVWVVDRGSTNGTVVTLVDGQQIICAEHQVVRLPEGATVTFGDYSASFVHRND